MASRVRAARASPASTPGDGPVGIDRGGRAIGYGGPAVADAALAHATDGAALLPLTQLNFLPPGAASRTLLSARASVADAFLGDARRFADFLQRQRLLIAVRAEAGDDDLLFPVVQAVEDALLRFS